MKLYTQVSDYAHHTNEHAHKLASRVPAPGGGHV
jgi:hypothetical protein